MAKLLGSATVAEASSEEKDVPSKVDLEGVASFQHC